MVETITPVVHGGRRGRWGRSVALHILGAAIGAAALGAALGAAGRVLGAPWGPVGLWAVAGIAALYAARELFGLPIPLPDRKAQVPEWWREHFGPSTAAVLYGLGLGVGFLTYLRHGTLVAVGALAVAVGDPPIGAAIVVPFGVARGLTVLAAAPGVTTERMDRVMTRIDPLAMSAAPRFANGALLVAMAVLAVAVAPSMEDGAGGSLAAELLGAVFAWAALAKIIRFTGWRRALSEYRLPLEGPLSVVVPVAEATVAVLALTGNVLPAAAAALVFLSLGTLAILRARRLGGDRLACGCFGGGRRRDYRLLVGRNVALAAVALASFADPSVGLPPVGRPQLLPVALALAGGLIAVLLGRELLRLRAVGARTSSD
jgi:hypothetical protein